MSSKLARRVALVAALAALALLVLVSAAPAPAGTPPNRLDDNRGDLVIQGAINSFVSLPLLDAFFIPFPILLPPPLGPLTPRVLEHPTIHNVYWDSNWDDHESGAFKTDAIDAMTQKLVDSNYFDFASQYDVGHASFDGSDTSGGLLNPCPSDPGSVTNFVSILFFIECETSAAPTGVPSPTGGPFGGDDLYVVYLPKGTTIDNFGINQSCASFGAYHFMGTTLTLLEGGAQVTFAAVPIDCANNDPDQLSVLASHEIIEASTDPNVGMGWIDDSKFDITNLTPLLTTGEAADICESIGDVPTDPVRVNNGVMVGTYWSNADNACVPFPTADLELSKTDSPDPAVAGGKLFYTLTLTNHGPNDVSDASVTDHLPSQVKFLADDQGICTEAPVGTLTCNFPKVLAGASSTVVITTQVKANAVPPSGAIGITNSAEVSSQKVIDPNPDNNTASASTTVVDSSDLKVRKDCKPDTPMPAGSTATCTITVNNLGPSDARAAVLTDTHISNGSFTITGVTPSPPCGASSGVVTCSLGTLAAGGQTTIVVTETATEAQDIDDCADVSSDTPDPNTSNNEACDGVSVFAVADLSLTKTDTPDPLTAGTNITYTLQAHNAGPSTAPSVFIRDPLPSSVTVVSVDGGAGSTCVPGTPGDPAHPTQCAYSTVAPGATKTMTLVVGVNPGDHRVVTNEASVSSAVFDPDLSNNIASATTAIQIADLGIVKTSDSPTYKPSAPITYTLTVTNNGPGSAQNVVVTDPLPLSSNDRVSVLDSSCTLGGTTATCSLGTMVPLTSRTITIAVIYKGKSGAVTNTATVASTTFDPFTSNNTSTKVIQSGSPPKP